MYRSQADAEERHLPVGRFRRRAAGYRACLRCQPDNATPVYLRAIDTPVGPLTLGATADAVVLVDFTDRPMMPAQLGAVRRRIGPTSFGSNPMLDELEAQLRAYLAGERRAFDLPTDVPGSPFQVSVWAELRRIPYGSTISYRELAARVGAPAATRAVGRANGSNRLAIVIPCHRVIAAGGGLGAYGGGLPAKRRLLDMERSAIAPSPGTGTGSGSGLGASI